MGSSAIWAQRHLHASCLQRFKWNDIIASYPGAPVLDRDLEKRERIDVGKRVIIILLGIMLTASPAIGNSSNDAVIVTLGSGLFMVAACWTMDMALRGEETDAKHGRRGWLVGFNASYGHPSDSFNDDAEDSLGDLLSPFGISVAGTEGSAGFTARAGYRCNERLSTELGIEWLDEVSRSVRTPGQGEIATTTTQALFVSSNAKGYLLSGRYQPFVIFGAGTLYVDSVTTNTKGSVGKTSNKYSSIALRMGGGLDYYITEHIVVDVEASYILPVSAIDSFKYLSVGVGLQYRF